ncbi:MAG: hypothetical protein H6779_05475 [Candidatus Nomurabacteria bacterium]|nr:MAG: hypothetical protein H6779_05475 [Candidatus Nomurabacteria bacterium]
MFVIPTNVGFTHRVVAMLVACAVVLWSLGAYGIAQAANLTDISNTLSDSGPSVTSSHDIKFKPASGLGAGDTISIIFPSGFTGVASTLVGDITVTVDGGGASPGAFSAVGQTISFNNITATSTQEVRVVVNDGIITNPAGIQSYEFQVTTPLDSGRMRVAIVDYVTVSAIVNTSFDFTVSGLATSTVINNATTTGLSSTTTIPFGVLSADTVYMLGQELRVSTNAINGFVVTVQQDGNLRSSTLADIDGFSDGTYVDTPTAWSAPGDSLLDENTWGHWGLTSDDSDLNSNEFNVGTGGDRWVAASTTPRQIFSHNGPSDGTTQDYGLAKVGYQIEVTPLQEAADDYQTTLMYIATPTF